MISDNTTTFQAAVEELKTLSSSEEARAVLNHEGVTCKESSMVWRLLGVPNRPYKVCNQKVLGRAHISLQVLHTIVVEVEALLNERPLTHVSHDLDDPKPFNTITLVVWTKNYEFTVRKSHHR